MDVLDRAGWQEEAREKEEMVARMYFYLLAASEGNR